MNYLVSLFLALPSALVTHEGGHYLVARWFGKRLKFRFAWGWIWKIPVPRWVWSMPYLERRQRRAVALAGFGVEFLAIPIFYVLPSPSFWVCYAAVAVAHLGLYRFYAGADSDFRWIQ
jgi:hypothetical protein